MSVKVALIQQAMATDTSANLTTSEVLLREAAAQGADLAVLPELHLSRYFCQNEDPTACDLAEPIPGPSSTRLGALAKELNLVIVASLFERRAPGLYHNTAVVLERDGTIAGRYRKMHIPDDPQYYEKFYFTPGDLGFRPITTSVGRLGVLVCWDQWYPEAARLMALAGAELLIYPTAIGAIPSEPAAERARQRDAWVTVQRGHAIANGLALVAVNRVGFEPRPGGNGSDDGIAFWGASFACGPQGELLAQADDTAGVTSVEIDLARSETVRRMWPFLRDRRIDAYAGLLKRYLDDTDNSV